MNEKYRSFLISYIAVPVVFYGLDGFLHSGLMSERVRFILIQLSLPVVARFVFKWLLENTLVKISRPIWGAWGASIGLIHWFPIYLELASLYIWEPVGKVDSGSSILVFFMNLVFPIVTLSGATYDATIGVIPISMLLFFRVATKKIGSSRYLDFGV